MKYVTVAMLAEHTCKQPATARRALKVAGVNLVRLPGARGMRATEKDANDFILKHWPDAAPISARLQAVPASRFLNVEDDVFLLKRTVDAL
ncbi:MAG: hypothetical protein ACO1QR_05165 [Chthoniobacteraceae bacterium]